MHSVFQFFASLVDSKVIGSKSHELSTNLVELNHRPPFDSHLTTVQ